MDGDEKRQRSLETGREMLARYKAERLHGNHSSNQSAEPSDAESSQHDVRLPSMDPHGSSISANVSLPDLTHSSISMSEGEGEGDLEGMAGRVAELEELLQGKEAVVEALNAEIDNLRGEASTPNSSQSCGCSNNYKEFALTCHAKLQEYERAVSQRDNLIEDLTAALEQALSARDAAVAQLNTLNALRLDNRSCTMEDNNPLHEKIESLEKTIAGQKVLTNEIKAELDKSNEERKKIEMESETQKAEIRDYKLQIDQLNERIRIGAVENNLNITETLEQQKQYETRVEKIKRDMQVIVEKFTLETSANTVKHRNEIMDLTKSHSEELSRMKHEYGKQLKLVNEENRILLDRLNKELPDLETRHAKELSVFQSQLANYKKTVEALKLELVNQSEAQRTAQAEVALYKSRVDEITMQMENTRRQLTLNNKRDAQMLQEQIKLHKIQLDEMTSKYVASTSVLESKESIERSLEQALTNVTVLREENESLKTRLDDLSAKYSAAQSLIENSQAQERSMNARNFDLEKSLSRLSGISINTGSEFNETTYQTFDEVALQYQLTKQRLDEKSVVEKKLVERIDALEIEVSRTRDELVKTCDDLIMARAQMDDTEIELIQAKKELENTKSELKKVTIELEKTDSNFKQVNRELDEARCGLQKIQNDLDNANDLKRSYEKELKDTRNHRDKNKSESDSIKEVSPRHAELFQSSLYFGNEDKKKKESEDFLKDRDSSLAEALKDEIAVCKRENNELQEKLTQLENEHERCSKQMHVLADKLKRKEEESAELQRGLASAWEQCAEFEEKLNQTLIGNESVSNDSTNASIQVSKLIDLSSSMNVANRNELNPTRTSGEFLLEERYKMQEDEIKGLQLQLAQLREEKDAIVKENEKFLEKQHNYEELTAKLGNLQKQFDELTREKQKLLEENVLISKQTKNDVNALELRIEQLTVENDMLTAEKNSLSEQINELIKTNQDSIATHSKELSQMKLNPSNAQSLKALSLGFRDDAASLTEFKAELEARHAKEMEKLRTYFEQKCLQMEKQYSEEVFSQQSKKMSDNDSDIEELTDDLYSGGGGDFLNVSCSNPKLESEFRNKINVNEPDTVLKSDGGDDENIPSIHDELRLRAEEVEELRSEYEKKLRDQENLHGQIVKQLEDQINERNSMNAISQPCQTDWDPIAVETSELTELRAAYSQQLEEQVALARLDIVNALQEQIQALLSADESVAQQSWPSELLELRDKFTAGSKQEIQQLHEQHSHELARLKEEHARALKRTVDRYEDELKKIKAEPKLSEKKHGDDGNLSSDELLIRERNNLHKTCLTLKNLVSELINYFDMCEEEVNNTLLSEVLKVRLSKSEEMNAVQTNKEVRSQDDDAVVEMEIKSEDQSVVEPSTTKIKRVHFAPRLCTIESFINDSTLFELIEEEKDVAQELRTDLDQCFDRLKSETAQILEVATTPDESKIDMLAKQVLWTSKMNEELCQKFSEAERIIMTNERETECLKERIRELQQKLTYAENKKEVISEGYGEHEESGTDVTIENLSQLQERARSVLSNGAGESSYLLQLIEDLCRQGDKVSEEAKKEREDLQSQIEAADKQVRATRKFLEEQATEREIERDEAARKIEQLQEQLKEKDREKERDQRITSESPLSPVSSSTYADTLDNRPTEVKVEALESQMHEISSMLSEVKNAKCDVESELKAAVDKIWVLRDIITDLEQQVQSKTEREEHLQNQIEQLEEVIGAQTRNQQELVQELDAIKMGSENVELNEHIGHLQEELRKHKLSTEQFDVNSSALRQMKMELRDMDSQLDKRIKELELLHTCGSSLSLSQPSEDVSVREQIDANRCLTPDDLQAPPTLPLDLILKLKDKMTKHSRAEEVAFRRIKDLEMQLTALKNQNEELQAEQEILQQTTSNQLFQIEAMRGRLEQQKQNAPFAQRQATSRLELQLHESNAMVHSLERAIADKDLEMKDVQMQLDRATQLLSEKEGEIASVVQTENSAIQKLKDRLELIEEEKNALEEKVAVQEQTQKELPQLLDSMLEDKNEEIDHLKEQLAKREKQLEIFFALNLNETQLRELLKQAEPKNSARTLSDILSIDSECEDFPEAIREAANFSSTLPQNVSGLKTTPNTNQSEFNAQTSLMSAIEPEKARVEIPRLELHSQSRSLSESCLPHSQSLTGIDLIRSVSEFKSSTTGESSRSNVVHSKSHDSVPRASLPNISKDNATPEIRVSVSVDDDVYVRKMIAERQASCPRHGNQATKMSNRSLHEGMPTASDSGNDLEIQLRKARQELEQKTMHLNKREAELNSIQRDLLQLRVEMRETIDTLMRDKLFYKEQYDVIQNSENKVKKDLLEVENTLKMRNEELREYKGKMQTNEKIIMELNSENMKLKQNLENKVQKEVARVEAALDEKEGDLKNCKDVILKTDITIETLQTRNAEIEIENKQLYEYKAKFETCKMELAHCQKEIERLTEGLNNRDLVIRRLEEMARRSSCSGASSPSDNKDQEIHHLQEHLKEKDKVIKQMSDDSKSLHRALETIQNKMKESGNIVELRKKLKEERRSNGEMKELIDKLREEIAQLRRNSPEASEDDVDIEDMVQRELEVSASLDQQIMSAITSETPKTGESGRRMERHACNSLNIEPVDRTNDDEIAQSYNDIRSKLKQANKANDELSKVKDDLDIVVEMLRAQVTEYENRILQIKADLEEESRKVGKLNEELAKERNIIRHLTIRFQREQTANHAAQMHDADLIAALRMKLEASLDAENKLRRDLSMIRREHNTIETQLNAVREQMKAQEVGDALGLKEQHWHDCIEAEQKKYVALAERYEKEERKNIELQDNLRRLESEKCKYERELEMANDEKEKLGSSLALIEGIKEHLETDLKRTRADLRSREDECAWLQKRIDTMTEAETKRQQQRTDLHHELKILRLEIANSREVMLDLEADMADSKKELAKYREREEQLVSCIETLRSKESELIRKLTDASEEEKRLKEQIVDMQNDLQLIVKREMDLNNELQNERLCNDNVPAKFVQKIKNANESAQKYLAERNTLREKLTKAREEKEQLSSRVNFLESHLSQQSQNTNNTGVMVADMIEKLQNIYGMFLRADSRRKALAYQKRFLLCIVGGYQLSEQSTLAVLSKLSHVQRGFTTSGRNKKNPRVRFRCAALVIISIHRMKWLIVRWRTGRRVGTTAVLGNADRSFVPLRKKTSNHSPPVRDRPRNTRDNGSASMLEHFLERCTSIQKKIDHAVTD